MLFYAVRLIISAKSVVLDINPKHVDHIRIRAAEADLAVAGSGRRAAVAENIDVRKSHMHSHGTKLATVGIVIEGISDFMTTVAATLDEPVNQSYLDFGFSHSITP